MRLTEDREANECREQNESARSWRETGLHKARRNDLDAVKMLAA